MTKNATSIALSYAQKRTARRVASNARLLLGKLSAIGAPFEALNDVRSRNQAAKRRALSRYPLNRAKYLNAGAMAATPKQTAAANAKLNNVVHMSRSYDCRRERDRSLCHRRLYCLRIVARACLHQLVANK